MVDVDWIRSLIEKNELWRFYKTPEWHRLKQQVLIDGHYECQICKQKGIVKRYEEGSDGKLRRLSTVHHLKEIKNYPELALDRENLIPICKACHNAVHDRSFASNKRRSFSTIERW